MGGGGVCKEEHSGSDVRPWLTDNLLSTDE